MLLCLLVFFWYNPESKVHEANMGPIWGRQDPGGPHVGPMNFAIWEVNFSHMLPDYSSGTGEIMKNHVR